MTVFFYKYTQYWLTINNTDDTPVHEKAQLLLRQNTVNYEKKSTL